MKENISRCTDLFLCYGTKYIVLLFYIGFCISLSGISVLLLQLLQLNQRAAIGDFSRFWKKSLAGAVVLQLELSHQS
jgi:hypothetical protein